MTVMSGRGPGGQIVMGGHYGQSGHHTGVHVCVECSVAILLQCHCIAKLINVTTVELHYTTLLLLW